jgi:hypothetical protein
MHEAQMHEFKCFITLTYDEANLPDGGTLVKSHLQRFIHELRRHKLFVGYPIKFFACGEYGEQTLRPHYHLLLYGVDFPDKKKYSQSERGDSLFTSAVLDQIWKRGQCKIGALTFESAAYCARYTLQKSGQRFTAGHYQTIDEITGEVIQLEPEFNSMSKHPGLGQTWFEKYSSDVYPDDFILINGRKTKPPRYYDKLLQRSNPTRLALIKISREKQSETNSHDTTTARLRVRETVKKSKLTTLKRGL